jgi:hypothetical protein
MFHHFTLCFCGFPFVEIKDVSARREDNKERKEEEGRRMTSPYQRMPSTCCCTNTMPSASLGSSKKASPITFFNLKLWRTPGVDLPCRASRLTYCNWRPSTT